MTHQPQQPSGPVPPATIGSGEPTSPQHGSDQATDPGSPATDERDPWEAWSWLLGAVWLIFLGFPLAAILTADHSFGRTLWGLGALAAFAATYLIGLIHTNREETWSRVNQIARRYLAGMVLLVAATVATPEASALTMLAFVVSFAMFTLPLWEAGGLYAACILAALVVPPLTDGPRGAMAAAALVALVGGFTGLIRILEQRQISQTAEQEELSLIRERERVARDVHDVLGHSLTVIAVKAELAQRLIDIDPQRAKAEVGAVLELSRTSLAEIRATVAGLRVARLDEEIRGAQVALASADIEVDAPQDISLVDPRGRLTLAWVIREASTNVIRHSGATRCVIELGPTWVSITDNGTGPGSREGNGLRGVRERLQRAGGRLSIREASPGSSRPGTVVRAEIAVTGQHQEPDHARV